jgi:hypothetical protein
MGCWMHDYLLITCSFHSSNQGEVTDHFAEMEVRLEGRQSTVARHLPDDIVSTP